MKKITAPLATAFIFAISIVLSAEPSLPVLKESKINAINAEYSFTYNFPEKPKVGTYVLKVNVLKNNEKVKDLAVLISYDMPSMKGAHSSGKPALMQLNRKNDYLMPMNFVMRGAWEIILIFQQNGRQLYSGKFLIDI